jgi:hypothetical protein
MVNPGGGGSGGSGGSAGGAAFAAVFAAEPLVLAPAQTVEQVVANYPAPVAPAPETLVGPSAVRTTVASLLPDSAWPAFRPHAGAVDRTEVWQGLDPAILDLEAGNLLAK